MTPRLSPVLCTRDLPAEELQAARLDGEVYAVDECFTPIDQQHQVSLRALALRTMVPPRLIAEQRTAAWVMGLMSRPPSIHQFCVSSTARVRPPASPRLSVREVVITDEEVVLVSGLRITGALRTAIDLARFSPEFGEQEESLVGGLMLIGRFTAEDCLSEMDRRTNLPGKHAAYRRLVGIRAA